MTTDELVLLIEAIFSQKAERGEAGFLACHTPDDGTHAYLARVYNPAPVEVVNAWAETAGQARHPHLPFLSGVANGLSVSNLKLYGVVSAFTRTGGGALWQPISLNYGNVWERPTGLEPGDLVIGSSTGWSAHGVYVMDRQGAVRLVHHEDGSDVAASWPDLASMLRAEWGRMSKLHDPAGRRIGSHTDLMHPEGRRWETQAEPGTTRH